MVLEMNSELDMLESNFTELLFKLNGWNNYSSM
jgi:hypothetical protein